MVRFSIDRRWATLVVAVMLGAGGGSLIGFVTAPAPGGDVQWLAPVQEADDLDNGRAGHDHDDNNERRHDHDQLHQHSVVADHDLDT